MIRTATVRKFPTTPPTFPDRSRGRDLLPSPLATDTHENEEPIMIPPAWKNERLARIASYAVLIAVLALVVAGQMGLGPLKPA